jgi:hypothetical protein
MAMEFVIVTFPDPRAVNIDGAPRGQTGQLLRLGTGTHRFDLGTPLDYVPLTQMLAVIGTTEAAPLQIPFDPLVPVTSSRAARKKPPKKAAKRTRRKRAAAKRKGTKRSAKRKTTKRKAAKRRTAGKKR